MTADIGHNSGKPDMAGVAITQKLDAAVADYQRYYGRLQLIERLKHMQARAEEAQRVLEAGARG
jgi:hypothetical protein